MKILLVHNYYGSSAPSGENRVFEAERDLLRAHGHEVQTFTRHSDEIRAGGFIARLRGLVKGAFCTVANPFAAWSLAKRCRAFRPDVVHFHNVFPLVSPLAVLAAGRHAPVVMTLHNYRTMCAAGVPMRDGKACSLCLDRRCSWSAVRHRCYRGSLLATLPLAVNIALYRRLLPRRVSRFVVLSEFQKRKMVKCGWPEDRIVVKGNFVDASRRGVAEGGGDPVRRNQILFVGRLSDEKGVATLVEAFRLLQRSGDTEGIGHSASHGGTETRRALVGKEEGGILTQRRGGAENAEDSSRNADRIGNQMVGRDVPSRRNETAGACGRASFLRGGAGRPALPGNAICVENPIPDNPVNPVNPVRNTSSRLCASVPHRGEIKGLKLVLIGDGERRGAYEALAKGLDVEFHGRQPNAVVRRAMSESKALVMPSEWWETFGLSAVEAMAEGTPCVVSDLGALPGIVRNGRLGEVFAAGDAEALAAAIVRLLSRPDYDALCRAVRHEAETKHSETANYRRLMEIYAEVL